LDAYNRRDLDTDDKVVATPTVARFAANGDELPPEESVYLVTRQHNTAACKPAPPATGEAACSDRSDDQIDASTKGDAYA